MAIDATGLDSRHTSRHYARRRGKRYRLRSYVLLAVAAHTQSHLIAAAEVRVGPTNESPLFADLIDQAVGLAPWARVLADKAYDAEHNHALARDQSFIRSTVIPLNRRRICRRYLVAGHFRPRRRFPKRKYGQRWQAESVFSRHKRLLDDALRSRSPGAQERECRLRVLTHNVMILAA